MEIVEDDVNLAVVTCTDVAYSKLLKQARYVYEVVDWREAILKKKESNLGKAAAGRR